TYGQSATYFEGDGDFSGTIDSGDLTIWLDNYGIDAPAPAAEEISLRIFAPYQSANSLPYVGYASRNNGNSALRPTLDVEQAARLVVTRFDISETGKLHLTYNVLNGNLESFNVYVAASQDAEMGSSSTWSTLQTL